MSIKKLHLGCGKKFIPGFYHVDLLPYPHIDRKASIANLDFIRSETVELIYASHVLEHFGRAEFENVLKEWHRVLLPKGILRLSVPDFKSCVEVYLETGIGGGLTGLVGLIVGGQRDEYDYHKMVFDEEYLSSILLRKIGFKSVQRYNWQYTEHADVDDYSQAYLPHMDKINGKLMSLNLEAIK